MLRPSSKTASSFHFLYPNIYCQISHPSVPALYEDALVYEPGSGISSTGALTAYSGKKTGRSPSDKRIVKEPSSEQDIWWGPVNKPMSPEVSSGCFFLSRHS